MMHLLPRSNTLCMFLHLYRLVPTSHIAQQAGVILQGNGYFGMLRPEALLADSQRTLIKSLGFGIIALSMREFRKAVETGCDLWVSRTEGMLADGQRALKKRLRMLNFALIKIHARQVVKTGGHVGMIWTFYLL